MDLLAEDYYNFESKSKNETTEKRVADAERVEDDEIEASLLQLSREWREEEERSRFTPRELRELREDAERAYAEEVEVQEDEDEIDYADAQWRRDQDIASDRQAQDEELRIAQSVGNYDIPASDRQAQDEELRIAQSVGNYDIPDHSKLIMVGDIHGDSKALISCLVDCAHVVNEEGQWIADPNTYIVFLGDLIDNYRPDLWDGWTTSIESEEELAIMQILNELNLQAMRNRGQVIHLLGNHELLNIQDAAAAAEYVRVDDRPERTDKMRLDGIMRSEMYNTLPDNSRKVYGILRINNWIMCHAGIWNNRLHGMSIDMYGTENFNLRNKYINDRVNRIIQNKDPESNVDLASTYNTQPNPIWHDDTLWNRWQDDCCDETECTNLQNKLQTGSYTGLDDAGEQLNDFGMIQI